MLNHNYSLRSFLYCHPTERQKGRDFDNKETVLNTQKYLLLSSKRTNRQSENFPEREHENVNVGVFFFFFLKAASAAVVNKTHIKKDKLTCLPTYLPFHVEEHRKESTQKGKSNSFED